MENMGLKKLKLFDNIYYGKKVLITGDTGFKGSWLATWLVELGAKVYGFSLPPKTQDDNYVKIKLGGKIKHKDGDIRNYKEFSSFFKEVKPDIAFHLAAQPLVIESYQNPKYTFETNIMGTVNFFEAVRNCKSIKVAINITSDKCYKNEEWVWGYRESDPIGGKDPYSASKGASEVVTYSYLHSFFSNANSVSIASVRAGNVIGGGDWAENRIVPDFFRAIKNKQSLTLRYPKATRPWQHVLEPLSGYLLLGAKLYSNGEKYRGAWNFGPLGDSHYTVEELVNKMIRISNRGSYIIEENENKFYEAQLLKLDISKAFHYLKWKPTLTFEETVKFTVQGYLDEIDGNNIYESRKNQILSFVKLSLKRNQY